MDNFSTNNKQIPNRNQDVFVVLFNNMEKFILDTNIFFNMEAGLDLGEKTEEVIMTISQYAAKLKNAKKAEFIMPPRAIDEFLSFFEDKEQPFIKKLLSVITVKSPDAGRISFTAAVFYSLIDDIRQRSYRGLNIAEEEIENAARTLMEKPVSSKKDFQINIGVHIKKFRERYRNATRTGFLDSVADLDLIVLAKEQDGFLISTDEGVLHWGRIFGVREMPCSALRGRLEQLAKLAPDHLE